MKKAAVIGSPALHKNYQTALERAGCSTVIFPDSSYVRKHPEMFDGLLLPGGGDVFSSFSDYAPFLETAPAPIGECGIPAISPARLSHPLSQRDVSSSASPPFGPPHASDYPHPDLSLTIEQLLSLHLFFEQKKPVFGICKGMQLINLYFRGTIREVSNRRLHKHPKKDTFHPADNLPGSFLHALFGPHMLINSCHHQCIDLPGQNLQVTQYASDGTAEAVSHLSAPVFGTQWHPERMPDSCRQDALLIFRYFVSLL